MNDSKTAHTQHFASDNWAGMAPEAAAALHKADAAGHAAAYGGDAWTPRARDAIRTLFDHDAEVFFFNGSAANALSLAAPPRGDVNSGQGGCRLMCAWDTRPETVDAFARDLAAAGVA